MAAPATDPKELARKAREAVRRLRAAGHEAYWVGGCVRDLLLGLTPKDYDLVTDARPDGIKKIFPRTIPVGEAFGIVVAILDGDPFQIATYRSDGSYSDHRRPDRVAFSTKEEDVRRRDFTINGMMYDPETGTVLDLVGGERDLADRVIRTIGRAEDRFAEDHLRLFRAVRFAARFGFAIEAATGEAVRRLAPDLATVSPERLREELVGLLTEGPPDLGVRMLDDYGLLPVVLPEVAALQGVEQPETFHPEGDVFVHTLLSLQHLPPRPSPELAMGTLLHDIGKPSTFTRDDRIRFTMHPTVGIRIARAICLRLRFSNLETDQILALVSEHMRFIDVRKMRESTLKRFFRLDRFEEHLALHLADCRASHGDVSNYDYSRARLEEFARDRKPLRPPRLVTGEDLIALGYKPGPIFKTMLEWAEDAQLEGRFATKEEGVALVRKEYPPPTGKENP